MNDLLKQIGMIIGIERELMCTHTARKTFATLILNESSVSMETVSAMLGHAEVATTQKYYSRVQQHKIGREMQGFDFMNLNTTNPLKIN